MGVGMVETVYGEGMGVGMVETVYVVRDGCRDG